MKKVKIGIVVLTAIIIIAIIVVVYLNLNLESKGELHFVNFDWNDNHPFLGSPYVHVEGTIFNSGERNAGEVKLIIRIYDSQNTLIKTETMDIGDIASKTYRNVSTDFEYSGDAYKIQSAIQWKPYG